MTTVEVVRSAEELSQAKKEESKRQIAEARAGERSGVGREAAADYLGISVSTLNRLNRNGIGPKSKQVSSSGVTAQNASVTYRLPDLDDWVAHNSGSSHKQKKLADQARQAATAVENLRLQLRVKELEEERARLEKLLKGKVMAFTGVADLMVDLEWCVDEVGQLLGNALTVDNDVLGAALHHDRLLALPLEQAVREPWANGTEWERWSSVALSVLSQECDDLAQRMEAQRSKAALLEALR